MNLGCGCFTEIDHLDFAYQEILSWHLDLASLLASNATGKRALYENRWNPPVQCPTGLRVAIHKLVVSTSAKCARRS